MSSDTLLLCALCGTKHHTKEKKKNKDRLSFTIDIRGRPIYGTDNSFSSFFMMILRKKENEKIKSHLSHYNHRCNLHVINLFECCIGTTRSCKNKDESKKVRTPHYYEMIACSGKKMKKEDDAFCLFILLLFVCIYE